ncbi:UNVERIFIED_CONTAM: hypothetical protein Sradi_2292100 [Sesamum radiatum]|uniref:NHL domain-containing protein n=1 Tax=Sesamum radiatum TaxID=300843 RepID=A0AAW2T4H3_SESRA
MRWNVLQFEDGYLVETVVEGNELGVVPYSIRVSQDGELFAVDAVNSNIVRITPPLSQYSRARLVAGSFQGHTGHVDGKPSDARFNHPKGVTMDDKGNVYVADTSILPLERLEKQGQCSSSPNLSKEDCDYENSSVSPTDLLMVAGAILVGYASCMLQQGFGGSFFSKMKEHSGTKIEEQSVSKETPTPVDVTVKEEQEAAWPSFGQLVWDLAKLAPEALGGIFLQFIPSRFSGKMIPKRGLTPLKDSLIMPEDEAQPSAALKQRAPTPLSETRQAHGPMPSERFSDVKPLKMRSTSLKDPSLSSKHRSSRRQEYAEFYGSGEVPQYGQVRSKSQKERTKHRQREKSGDATFAASVLEPKPAEIKSTSYDPKYDPYNFRGKYGDSYRFD